MEKRRWRRKWLISIVLVSSRLSRDLQIVLTVQKFSDFVFLSLTSPFLYYHKHKQR